MKFQYDGFNWLLRLEKGELLVESLTKLIKDENIRGAWVSGLGGVSWAELGFYSLDTKQYKWKKFEQALEITSLQGNIAWSGEELVLHLHGTFSDDNLQAYGGHVKEAEVAGTCEILLHRWYKPGLERSEDEETGLKLLDL
jgi:predicted DNA-binding protein with PD1-like motif